MAIEPPQVAHRRDAGRQGAGAERLLHGARVREEAEPRQGREDLLPARRHRHDDQPREREHRHPRVARLAHLDDHRGADAERHRGEQLVGDAEQRPERVDAAERIDRRPARGSGPTSRRTVRCERTTAGIHEVRPKRRPDVLAEVLEHEAADARAGVERGEDEQRLEHDGEVIPERHRRLAAEHAREDVRHADREARRAAGAREQRRLADLLARASPARRA